MLEWRQIEAAGKLRRILEPPLLVAVFFLGVYALCAMVEPAVSGWLRKDWAYLGWLDAYWLVEPGTLTVWLAALGLTMGAGLALSSGWTDRLPMRIAAGLFGLASAAAVGYLIVSRPEVHKLVRPGLYTSHKAALPWLAIASLTAGAFAGAWIASGRAVVVEPSWPRRGLATLGVCGLALVVGTSTIVDTWDEYRGQTFPPFAARLVAVRPMQPKEVLTDKTPTLVFREIKYVILPQPAPFRFTNKDVERVRRRTYRDYRGTHAGVSIRFSSHLHDKIAARSRTLARWRASDAIFVDGRLITVAAYHSALYDGRMLLTDSADDKHRAGARLHRELTK